MSNLKKELVALRKERLRLLAKYAEMPAVDRPGVGTEDKGLIVITGCPRSGTRYTAALLRLCGKGVGHESLGPDGVVAHWLAGSTSFNRSMPDPETVCSKAGVVLHQVRHPLRTIPSIVRWVEFLRQSRPKHYSKWCTYSGGTYEIAAKFWLDWNVRCAEIAEWTYHVEDIDLHFGEFCERTGAREDWDAFWQVARTFNHGPTTAALTLVGLKDRVGLEVCARIATLALEFGYII